MKIILELCPLVEVMILVRILISIIIFPYIYFMGWLFLGCVCVWGLGVSYKNLQ